jgi:hypothetical protein
LLNQCDVNKIGDWNKKFKPVNGQVILIEASKASSASDAETILRGYWEITADMQVMRLGDCMLRGVSEVKDENI